MLSDPDRAVQTLLDCWPRPLAEVTAAVGITGQQLRRYLAGTEDLPTVSRLRLFKHLGLRYEPHGADAYLQTPRGYVLHAAPSYARMVQAYEELTTGGDIEFSIEIVPPSAPYDLSWRYLLVQPCGDPLIVIAFPRCPPLSERRMRRETAAAVLGGGLINHFGPCCVDPQLYAEVAILWRNVQAGSVPVLDASLPLLDRWSDYLGEVGASTKTSLFMDSCTPSLYGPSAVSEGQADRF